MPTPEADPHVAPGGLALAATCAHGGCTCTVDAGERYCSEYCLVQAERTDDDGPAAAAGDEDGCTCGHAACVRAARPVLPPPVVGSPVE